MVTRTDSDRTGFIGTGIMGTPMASNLAGAIDDVVVWNRTVRTSDALSQSGIEVAESLEALFAKTRVVFLMVTDDSAVDEILGRGTHDFTDRVQGHVVVPMGAHSPSWARHLAEDVRTHGGAFVGAPVAGSRLPAEQARLAALMGGEESAKDEVAPLLAHMCTSVSDCGGPSDGFAMKLAFNLFQTSLVASLAETLRFAGGLGLDQRLLVERLGAGAMGSEVVRDKLSRMLRQEFDADASVANALLNLRIIAEESNRAAIPLPLSEIATNAYERLADNGYGDADFSIIGSTSPA